nr:RHS repeat-associated core domain-containing protein [Paenibacillus sp. F411]
MRGSTTRLTDEEDDVTDRYTYGAFGELVKHEGTTRQPFAYNGRDGVQTDINGLYYMRARYYNPEIKRFMNRDVLRGEVSLGLSMNRFAYVNGNPVTFVDPLGLDAIQAGKRKGIDKPYTKSSLKLGQQMHKSYKSDKVLEGVREKEFRLPSGKRIDFIDFEKKIIYELKSYNPRAMRQGNRQLERYKKEVEGIYGGDWKTKLDVY